MAMVTLTGIRFLTMVSVFLCVFSTAATAVLSESKPLIAAVLSDLHFQDLATAAVSANFTAIFPITIFAPKQSSLLTCRSCSVVRLLREHTVRGLYSFEILRKLPFGSKIQTLADNRCLSVTTTRAEDQKAAVFINGVEIAEPDLFNNGVLIVHSIQGFVSHLSPLSCRIESMATLSFPENPPSTAALFAMRTMLKETMTALRTSGYSIMALSMRVKYPEISELRSMTLFAVDDETIFTYGGGVRRHNYAAELGFHIVPNKLLYADDLLALPRGTLLPTMQRGRYLEITTAGGGGLLSRMRINYVKVKQLGIVHNNRVAVHSLMMPI